MNMKKVAQAFRLLADAMDGTELTELRVEDTGVSGPDKEWKDPKPEPKPEKKPAPEPEKKPEPKPEPAMTRSEFTTAMQSLGREVGTTKLHAILPAVWETYTNGVARMSAIPADRYAEIVEFTRKEVEKQA